MERLMKEIELSGKLLRHRIFFNSPSNCDHQGEMEKNCGEGKLMVFWYINGIWKKSATIFLLSHFHPAFSFLFGFFALPNCVFIIWQSVGWDGEQQCTHIFHFTTPTSQQDFLLMNISVSIVICEALRQSHSFRDMTAFHGFILIWLLC